MPQLCHRLRLAQKTIGNVCIAGKLTPDDLDSNGAFETEVRGKENGAHAAGPDFTFYLEPASDNLGDIHIDLPSGKRSQRSFGFGLVRGKRRHSLAPIVVEENEFICHLPPEVFNGK
jgi:hypothetical protein